MVLVTITRPPWHYLLKYCGQQRHCHACLAITLSSWLSHGMDQLALTTWYLSQEERGTRPDMSKNQTTLLCILRTSWGRYHVTNAEKPVQKGQKLNKNGRYMKIPLKEDWTPKGLEKLFERTLENRFQKEECNFKISWFFPGLNSDQHGKLELYCKLCLGIVLCKRLTI